VWREREKDRVRQKEGKRWRETETEGEREQDRCNISAGVFFYEPKIKYMVISLRKRFFHGFSCERSAHVM